MQKFPTARQLIALLTDFGSRDTFVGVMKGVILNINPEARLVDLTHELEPQDILGASLALQSALDYFPQGTIFVAVVDPGVGSGRRGLCLASERHLFVGPDNGLFGFLQQQDRLQAGVSLEQPSYFLEEVSNTFHGRDIFAPVAGHLSRRLEPARLGPPAGQIHALSLSPPVLCDGVMEGHVLHVDRFGNLITSIDGKRLVQEAADPHRIAVELGTLRIVGVSTCYADVPRGKPLLIVGSTGHLELSVREGNASRVLGVGKGTTLRVLTPI